MAASAHEEDTLKPMLPSPAVDRWTAPMRRFLGIQSASGIVLVVCTLVALLLANSRWSESFLAIWHWPCEIRIGSWTLRKDLLHVINDGLMTIFFFVVGLEIKREIVAGELRELRKAMFPVVGAIGGMVAPALVFLVASLLTGAGKSARDGWAIPMATDIAFVVGVLTLFGSRVPTGLKVFLLSLAIVDDLGAVLIIAFVFTNSIDWTSLLIAAAAIGFAWGMRRGGVRNVWLYVGVGAVAWLGVLKSGVHPTVAGVLLGLMTPATPWIPLGRLADILESAVDRLRNVETETAYARMLSRAEFAAREGVPPLERLEHALHPWVAFGIMPLFALANAGVVVRAEAATHPISLAVAAGLVLGKPLGIVLLTWLAVKVGITRLPDNVSWMQILGGGCLAGIGFTMSIFLAGLALPGDLLDAGKLGTLLGSLISTIIGVAILLRATKSPSVKI